MSLILTKAGLNAYAQSETTGTKLQATHMAVGDGGGAPVAHTDTSEGLVNETWRGELQKIEVAASGEVEFQGHVPLTVGGWYIREIAIYADDTLLALSSHPETWKPAPEAPDKVELVITAPVKFANTDNISLTVDTTKVLASQDFVQKEISEHDAAEDSHADIRAAVQDLLSSGGDHAARKDNPHGVTLAQIGLACLAETPLAIDESGDVSWDAALDVNATADTGPETGPNAVLELTANATMAKPTNMVAGVLYTIRAKQDDTGGRTIAFDAAYVGSIPAMPKEANAEIVYSWYCAGTKLICRNAPDIAEATVDAAGILELATQEEVDLGEDNERAVTSKTLKNWSGGFDGVVSLVSTRESTGTWTITGLTVGKPLIICVSGASPAISFRYRVVSGSDDGVTRGDSYYFNLQDGGTGNDGVVQQGSANSTVIIPTADTVVLYIPIATFPARAYQ